MARMNQSNEVKVRMLEDARGSLNGFDVLSFRKGTEYALPRELASAFIGNKEAQEVKQEKG